MAQTPSLAEVFGHAKTVEQVSISPDGQRLAIIGSDGRDGLLSIATVDTDQTTHLKFGPVEPLGVTWVGNDHLVVRVAAVLKAGEHRYRFKRNILVTADGRLGPKILEHDVEARVLIDQRLVGVTKGPHPHVLIAATAMGAGGLGVTIYDIDPATGEGPIVAHQDRETQGLRYDPAAQVFYRLQQGANETHRLEVLSADGKTWSPVLTFKTDAEAKLLDRYSAGPQPGVYLWAEEGDGARLTFRRLADGAVTEVAPLQTPAPLSYLPDPYDGKPVAAVSAATAGIGMAWLDADLAKVQGSVLKALGGRSVVLFGWSADRTRFVVTAYGQDAPSAWYLYDRARHQLSPIGEERPALENASLGTTSWITYPAQDGTQIPAYFTLPRGAPASGGRLPLIVMPHSGPMTRDAPELDPVVQFLAARGYAVLRPQFRGSRGFGKTFEAAGDREWGGKMQTDLTDGIANLAASGTIDPHRVCVVGQGFGGYAALAGVTLHPDSYRCAVSFVGVSDLVKFAGDTSLPGGSDPEFAWAWRAKLAKVGSVDPLLADISPDRLVARVRAPILLIEAEDDPYAGVGQSALMADALTRAGKPFERVMIKDTSRRLTTTAALTQMLEVLDAFLAKALPVTADAAGPR